MLPIQDQDLTDKGLVQLLRMRKFGRVLCQKIKWICHLSPVSGPLLAAMLNILIVLVLAVAELDPC